MIPIDGQPILTAAEMRAAEDRAITAGLSVQALMERAGAGVAEAVRRLAAGAPVLVLCGPGNNGGNGYVAARVLKANGVDVRVAASGDPKSDTATAARNAWNGAVESFDEVRPAPVSVDAVFGTGLSRPLTDEIKMVLARAAAHAHLNIAIDLPSGVETDSGALLGAADSVDLPFGERFKMRTAPSSADVTLALGAVKPAHVLYPAAGFCGTVRLIDIGVPADSDDTVIGRPWLTPPASDAHKYSRGMVAIVGGAMPGAAALCAEAAMRAGAGYALLLADRAPGMPHAVVHRAWSTDALDDNRIGAIVVGPGLGRDSTAKDKLEAAVESAHPLVIDGDALHLLDDSHFSRFRDRESAVVLTPHAGEFSALFGDWSGSKIDAARHAAGRANAYVAFKGPDTVIAMPDGYVVVSSGASSWLSTAGTGDVLAGATAAMLARPGGAPIHAIATAVWLHAEAARRLGGAFIADDLMRELTAVRGSL